jgi:1-acyl-sn-glycerol-3-phosphate acyltransferase
MENPFPGDSYDTPEDQSRFLGDRLFFNTRFYFYLCNFYVFYRLGTLSRQGLFAKEMLITHSYMNFRLVEGCGGRVHLRGLNNLSKVDGPALLIGNHMSLLETAIMHAMVRPRRDLTFVIKDSLTKIPYFGDIMRAMNAISVGRANPRDDFKVVMEQGKQRLKDGKSIILFPQSTRSEIFEPEKFNTIGVKLAKAANVPIIPFALKTDFLGNGKYFRDLGPLRRDRDVHFEFAEPMEVKGNGKGEHKWIVDFIQQKQREWNE